MAKRNYKNFKKNKKAKVNSEKNQTEVLNSVEDYLSRVNKSSKCVRSKEYLDTFERDRANWKFNKMLQVFILNHILIKDVFSKEYFEIFKLYYNKMNAASKKSFYDQSVKNVQDFKDGKLTLIKNTTLKFKDEVKEKHIKEIFHKRCVSLIESN